LSISFYQFYGYSLVRASGSGCHRGYCYQLGLKTTRRQVSPAEEWFVVRRYASISATGIGLANR
jgi:alkylhydroperoxidase family enzyme